MKTSKKAVLGFAVAMVVSLSVMQGNAMKSNKQDVSIQQLGGAAAIGATYCESGGGAAAGLNYTAATLGATAAGMATAGAYAAVATTTNPVGWGYWGVTVVVGL